MIDSLIVVLAPEHPVVFADAVGDAFQHAGRYYRDAGLGDFTGFYDWLRDAGGGVIGVRYWPFEASRAVCDEVAAFPYVDLTSDRSSLAVFFSAERAFDPANSGDQAFGGNRVFVAADGAYALTFDAGTLDDVETARGIIAPATRGS
jgi:hypothetical protein